MPATTLHSSGKKPLASGSAAMPSSLGSGPTATVSRPDAGQVASERSSMLESRLSSRASSRLRPTMMLSAASAPGEPLLSTSTPAPTKIDAVNGRHGRRGAHPQRLTRRGCRVGACRDTDAVLVDLLVPALPTFSRRIRSSLTFGG